MNPLRSVNPMRRVGHRRGQTLIFLLMVTVILSFVMFSVYDTQHVVVQRVPPRHIPRPDILSHLREDRVAHLAGGFFQRKALRLLVGFDIAPLNSGWQA